MNKCYHEVTALGILKSEVNVRDIILTSLREPEKVALISFVGWSRINDNDIKATYAVFLRIKEGDDITSLDNGRFVSVVWSAEKYTFSIAS